MLNNIPPHILGGYDEVGLGSRLCRNACIGKAHRMLFSHSHIYALYMHKISFDCSPERITFYGILAC